MEVLVIVFLDLRTFKEGAFFLGHSASTVFIRGDRTPDEDIGNFRDGNFVQIISIGH